MSTTQTAIQAALRAEAAARPEEAATRIEAGDLLVGVSAGRTGLCTNVSGQAFPPPAPGRLHDLLPGLSLAGLDGRAASLAVAAAGALLPPPQAPARKAQDLLLAHGTGKRVVVVGHFPFVAKMGPAFASFHVLERVPRPGDLPVSRAAEVLPGAQMVAVTASALANGSLGEVLDLCGPEAVVLLVGPSTPFAACLFDFGIHVLCGNVTVDATAVLDGVARGLPYRALSGLRAVCAVREDFAKTR